MKFESGIEQKNRDKKKKEKGPNFFEKYQDFNQEPVPELLEKRKKEHEKFVKRQELKLKKLREEEKKGKLVTKINM